MMNSRVLLVVALLVLTASLMVQVARADDDPALALFKKGGCDTCHSISALKVVKVEKKAADGEAPAEEKTAATSDKKKKDAPDLSGVGLAHDAKWISGFINKTETTKDGEKHEKRYKGTEADRRTLAMWLATLKHEVKKPAAVEGDGADKKE